MKCKHLAATAVVAMVCAIAGAEPSAAQVLPWKATVATVGALPSSGNRIGDTRWVLSPLSAHYWDGAAWQSFGGGAPTGAAGGSLSGTYPNPHLAETVYLGGTTADFCAIYAPEGDEEISFAAADDMNDRCAVFVGPITAAGDLIVQNNNKLRLQEAAVNGSSTIDFRAPADVTATVICDLEDDTSPIPDSCVGDGTDGVDGGAAATAVVLVANGANCAAGQYPLGVDAAGAAEDCTAVAAGAGDVVGPASAVDNEVALFDGTSGKLLEGSGLFAGVNTLSLNSASGGAGTLQSTSHATKGVLTLLGSAVTFSNGTNTFNATISAANEWTLGSSDFVFRANTSNFALRGTTHLTWANGSTANGNRTGILELSAGLLRITDGSTGIGKLLHGTLVEANTAGSGAPNVITAAESLTLFTNEAATAENYHTLPAAVAGLVYTFVVQDADGIRVVAAAGDTIQVAADVSGAAGYCESTTIGDSATFTAINATQYVATALVGTGWACT